MGVFGAGLYSGDFAMDLRSTIGAVSRLPFDADGLVEILIEAEPAAANHETNEDHTIFWLVVADQFAKRGIVCERVREKALAIIDGESDLAMHQRLGMRPADLNKRRKMLAELRARLTAPQESARPRPVLKKPQPLLMEIGDVLIYPTAAGKCINPYLGPREKNWTGSLQGRLPWNPDGWSAMVIIDRGQAFDFLSWYRPLTVSAAMMVKPSMQDLRADLPWRLRKPGTCSLIHFQRMELQKIGAFTIDGEKLRSLFPNMKPGRYQAVNDISIANSMGVIAGVPGRMSGRPDATVLGIESILA